MTLSKKALSAYERWELPILDKEKASSVLWSVTSDASSIAALSSAEELESIHIKAQQEGFSEGKKQGYEQGYAAGLAAGQTELQQAIVQFSQLIHGLVEPVKKQDEHLEYVLLTLIQNICAHLLKRELILNNQGILLILREALDKIPMGQHRVKIYVNAQDYAQVEKFLPQQSEYDTRWRLLVNDQVASGGCMVETDQLLLDATLDERLQQFMDQLYKKGNGF